MILTLPVASDVPHYTMQVNLEGAAYALELRWNDRAAAWFLSIGTPEGTPLVSGVRVVTGVSLLGRFADPQLPPGMLVAGDTSGGNQDPGRNDLGNRVTLFYFDSTEAAP